MPAVVAALAVAALVVAAVWPDRIDLEEARSRARQWAAGRSLIDVTVRCWRVEPATAGCEVRGAASGVWIEQPLECKTSGCSVAGLAGPW